MSPLGKRIIVFLMIWVVLAMVVLQLYDNVTGKGIPMQEPSAVATTTWHGVSRMQFPSKT